MAELLNRVWMTITGTGTGDVSLGVAKNGYRTFADAGAVNGTSYYYAIRDGNAQEMGHLVYNSAGPTITRTVLESTNSNNPLDLTTSAEIICTPLTVTFDQFAKTTDIANKTNWDTAYSWGNHAEAGYLTEGVDITTAELTTIGDFLGTFTLPASDGTDGQVLTTDGAGGLLFEDAAGGLVSATTSGASQTVDFGATDIHNATIDSDNNLTLTFSNPGVVSQCAIIVENLRPGGNSNADYTAPANNDYTVTENATIEDVAFNNDGTKMYVLGRSTSKAIYQYTLSTANDPSTATYDSVLLNVSSQESLPRSFVFSPDGTKLYLAGQSQTIFQYDLSTAWNLSTASYSSNSLDVSSQVALLLCIAIRDGGPDAGASIYAGGSSPSGAGQVVAQYDMTTDYDLSTASYASKSLDLSGQMATAVRGIYFGIVGDLLYAISSNSDTVFVYSLSSIYDVSTGAYADRSKTFSVDTPGMAVGNNKSPFYLVDGTNNKIVQFDILKSASVVWPSTLEFDGTASSSLTPGRKTAFTIATTDNGASYQMLAKLEGIS